jgi:DNA polymerase-3 subunit gamma/tau
MAYKALYRTYRPADFDEIAGQEHITKTFRNALVKNKIAHAYLFSGPRGTGKTSIAKIIAKAVNCEKAPIENPCNECDICLGIENNTINDVIEIDAASNNGVDEIREIRDKVKYLPGVGKYKVYIIDEVHMLSTGAFNALLKTLEEPPKHVIFILATTEPHKIPATIHSRCQRFDFRGVSVPDMIKTLNIIIKKENIGIEKEAIKVIAESAEGGMRDAISLLDQVVSYSNQNVTTSDVHAIRGTVSNELLLKIANAIYENNSVEAIKQLDDLIMLGKEAPRLVENLIKFYRDVLIYKNVNTEYDDHLIYKDENFIELSKKISNNMIFYYIECLNKAQNDMKWTSNAKLYMELALIKMVDKVEKQEIYYDDEISSLNTKIDVLNEKIDNIDIKPSVVENPTIDVKPVKEESIAKAVEVPIEKVEIIQENPEDEEFKDIIEEEAESDDEIIINPKPLYTEDDIDRTEKEEVVEETNIFNTPVPEPVVKESIPYKTFDIRYVEDVLNNAKREVKVTMNMKWYDIERATDSSDLTYAKMITEGRLVATDGRMIIIQYSNASICNRMMKPEIKGKIIEMLSDFFDVEIDYLALPEVVWQEKSQEFIKKWKRGEKNIKLTPIRHPELRDMPTIDHEVEDMTPDSVKEAISLFGSDIVKVKKGD